MQFYLIYRKNIYFRSNIYFLWFFVTVFQAFWMALVMVLVVSYKVSFKHFWIFFCHHLIQNSTMNKRNYIDIIWYDHNNLPLLKHRKKNKKCFFGNRHGQATLTQKEENQGKKTNWTVIAASVVPSLYPFLLQFTPVPFYPFPLPIFHSFPSPALNRLIIHLILYVQFFLCRL